MWLCYISYGNIFGTFHCPGRAKVKEHWGDARTPPGALIEHMMRVFCTLYLEIHVRVFNGLISRLTGNCLAVSAGVL
jgi:hypothetical protein